MKSRILYLLAGLALLLGIAPRPALAATGAVRATATPTVLLSDGVSTATVTAEVRNSSGRPVKDGTEVRFYTTAGTITPLVFTSAGVARATLTASSLPQAANITVSVGLDQTVLTIPMVSKLVETSVGGRVLKITGKYVAFSEDKRFIQADEQVKIRFRGLQIEANSVQVDLNEDTVKALGKVQISSDDKTLLGERLWLNLNSFEGYILAVGTRQWFSAYGLTELPERPKNINPDFELVDLSDSRLLWVSKQANYVVGERVQVQGARAYVGGLKSLRMPFHQSFLNGGGGLGTAGAQQQYIGIGSEGITLDLPLYVRMTPGSSTALNVGYGSRSGGIGRFTRQDGLSVDLVQKYGFSGASEGEARVTNLNSFNHWGFNWTHSQQLNKTTRIAANIQFPEHRDLYGQVNFTTGLPIGTLTGSAGATKLQRGSLAKNMSLAFETKPKPLADGKVAVSGELSFVRRDAQELKLARGFRVPVPGMQYQAAGIKVRPASVTLGSGLTLDSSASLRAVSGSQRSGFGPALETTLRKTLSNGGSVSVGVNYNGLTGAYDLMPLQGKVNATLNLMWPVTKRLKLSALGNMALDAENRHSILQASYQLTPQWRVDLLHSLFQFGQIGNSDYQFGIARMLGDRELGLYWSQREHKLVIEFGAGRF